MNKNLEPCPKCRSATIEIVVFNPSEVIIKCTTCGFYTGPFGDNYSVMVERWNLFPREYEANGK